MPHFFEFKIIYCCAGTKILGMEYFLGDFLVGFVLMWTGSLFDLQIQWRELWTRLKAVEDCAILP
jgi:hypothetical protein